MAFQQRERERERERERDRETERETESVCVCFCVCDLLDPKVQKSSLFDGTSPLQFCGSGSWLSAGVVAHSVRCSSIPASIVELIEFW